MPRTDFRERGATLERAWYPEKSSWTQARLGIDTLDVEDQGGQHLDRTVNLYGWAQGPRQSFVRFDVTEGDRFYGGSLFDTDRVTLYGEMQAHPDVYVYGQMVAGQQVDFANVSQGDQLRVDPACAGTRDGTCA